MHKSVLFVLALPAALFIFAGCATSSRSTQTSSAASSRIAYDLDSGWVCSNIKAVGATGQELSQTIYSLIGWIPATVPGTVLTTLLNDSLIPDPFWGMNNEKIPDIYETGPDFYTYWFVKNFNEIAPTNEEQVWLRFRGINYGCNVYVNGHMLNSTTHYGMFLRQEYNITRLLSKDGKNRLAVLVYPPDPVGNPNGGQGGDGTIGRAVSNQFVAGWDWIQPVRDRNTGVWDKVTIVRTKGVLLEHPHVVTIVPGRRLPGAHQEPAIIRASVDVTNPTDEQIRGGVSYSIGGNTVKKELTLRPKSTETVQFPDYSLENPRLWWPNGYGEHPLYTITFHSTDSENRVLDELEVKTGVREINTTWNGRTRSREVLVNGQRIFIKGGNWIVSDAMLRLSKQRYEAEVHFHRDMNLNLIRVWGGGITERPEFYDACDKHGIMVFQDFWMSGDCNGKWLDPKKKENQWTRRAYPDDHRLFLESVADQVRMLRNHASLAFYCGGNEIPPPEDILIAMQDSIFPSLDSTRYFFSYSNVDSMSFNNFGGNGDGVYHVQPVSSFWQERSFPFNSEIGSVGMGDTESLRRFIPSQDLMIPDTNWAKLDSVWKYHKYLGYGKFIDAYGKTRNLKNFADAAQLVNYDQYRGLMEGHIAHMWAWYTGVIVWKTQNPWTALRGQMYDYYLDPNAGLYGLQHANEPLHVMYNPMDGMITVVNHTFRSVHDLMIQVRAFDISGRDSTILQWLIEIGPSSVLRVYPVKHILDNLFSAKGGFLSMTLVNAKRQVVSGNFYWLCDSAGNYSGLQQMERAGIEAKAIREGSNRIVVAMHNPSGGPVAFFTRISLVNAETRQRILPAFPSDNYVSVLPGETKEVSIVSLHDDDIAHPEVCIEGWNVAQQWLPVQ